MQKAKIILTDYNVDQIKKMMPKMPLKPSLGTILKLAQKKPLKGIVTKELNKMLGKAQIDILVKDYSLSEDRDKNEIEAIIAYEGMRISDGDEHIRSFILENANKMGLDLAVKTVLTL